MLFQNLDFFPPNNLLPTIFIKAVNGNYVLPTAQVPNFGVIPDSLSHIPHIQLINIYWYINSLKNIQNLSISHFFIAATLGLATITLHLDYYNMYPVDIPISMLAPSTLYSQHIIQSNSVKLLKKIILTLFKNLRCISHIKSSKG